MKKTALVLSLVILGVVVARADLPPRDKSKVRTPVREKVRTPAKEAVASLGIHTKSYKKEPTLTIKRSALKQLRAAIDEADDAQNYAESREIKPGFSRTQTIVAGAFFSLAFIFGGVWMFRVKEKPSKIALSLIFIAALGAGATVIFANTPPPSAVNLTSRIFGSSTKAYGYARGEIKVVITDDKQRDDFYLEIPRAEEDPDLKQLRNKLL